MKNNPLIYVLVLLVLVSCYDIEKPDKPKDLIPENQMVDVLVDITIMSSAKGINKRILENNGISPVAYIYNKHGIDSTQFAKSNQYYAYDIEKYDRIYAKVKDSLERLREKYKAIQKEETEKKDKEKDAKKKLLKETKPKQLSDSFISFSPLKKD